MGPKGAILSKRLQHPEALCFIKIVKLSSKMFPRELVRLEKGQDQGFGLEN